MTPSSRAAWACYARVQQRLGSRTRIDDRAWGLEAEADQLLLDLLATDNAARAGQTAARRERYRASIRGRGYDHAAWCPGRPDDVAHARQHLRVMREAVGEDGWRLMLEVAAGHSYEEIATRFATTAGALRVRMLRWRRELAA